MKIVAAGRLEVPAAAPRPSRRYAGRIVAALRTASVPVTAQEVFTELRATGQRTGLATVYRALHALEQTDAIHAIRRDGQVAYRVCGPGRHDHLLCEACGAVEEIPRDRLEAWLRLIAPGRTPAVGPQQISSLCSRCGR